MAQIESTSQDPVFDSTGSPAGRPTWVRYQVLAVGWSFALLIYIQRQAFVRAVPSIKAELGFDTEQAGYLASAFLIAYGIFQIPCGLIGDRVGARHLLVFLVLGWSLFTGLTALAGDLPFPTAWQFAFLFGLRFLFGIMQAGGFPVWARVMADWMPVAERATAQGSVWMFSRLGGAIGPFMFYWLLNYFGTWRTPLWVLAAIGPVWCAGFWLWFRNRPDEMPQVNAAERKLIEAGRPPPATDPGPIPWLAICSSLNIWALSVMYGCVGFAGNFVTSLLPVYLNEYRHLDDKTTTLLSSLPLAFGVISCVLGGFLSDWITRRSGNRKWGRRIVPAIGLTCSGLALMSVPNVEPTWLLALLLSASFFCNDLMMGPAWATCADVGERYAGTVSGIMNMIGQFTGAAGMAFAGSMLKHGHPGQLFFVFGCSYGIAGLCWLAVDVTKPLVVPQTLDQSESELLSR